MATAAGEHRPAEGVAPVHDTVQVDGADPLPVVERHVGEPRRHPDAGIVHQHVERTVVTLDLCRQRLHRGAIGDVALVHARDLPELGAGRRRGLGRHLVDVDREHRRTPAGKGE